MSGLPFELLLALRYLRPKRTFVSVITLISVLGVTLGVAVLIIVISVMSGFDQQLREKILGFSTHMRVIERNHSMSNYQELAGIARSNPEVKAVTPFVLGQVLAETEPRDGQAQVSAPWLRGLDPLTETNISVLPSSIKEGIFDVRDRGVVVGSVFAENMNLAVGDLLTIYSPDELRQIREAQGKEGAKVKMPDEYEVRGIFDVGYYEYDSSVIVTSLEDAQKLYVLDTNVHGLLVMLRDPYKAPQVQREMRAEFGPGYRISTWMEENDKILSALIVEKNVMFYLLFFIMIVAALCILSALITFVIQKTREIGMLKALGAEDLQVSLLFLSQGAMVGAVGCLAGFGLGWLALVYRNEFLRFMNWTTGFELFPAEIYGFAELPAIISASDVMLICGSAFVVCILGGVIPAWRAGRLKPVEALRYE
jgi:lipoprotein-releasing system permease protein